MDYRSQNSNFNSILIYLLMVYSEKDEITKIF